MRVVKLNDKTSMSIVLNIKDIMSNQKKEDNLQKSAIDPSKLKKILTSGKSISIDR